MVFPNLSELRSWKGFLFLTGYQRCSPCNIWPKTSLQRKGRKSSKDILQSCCSRPQHTAAWKLDLHLGFSGAKELRNLSKGYHTATEKPTARKLQTFWQKVELKKENHPKLPRTSLTHQSVLLFRLSANKKLLQGKSRETHNLQSSKSFRKLFPHPLSLSDLKMYSYSIYEALGALGVQALSLSEQRSDTEIYKVK